MSIADVQKKLVELAETTSKIISCDGVPDNIKADLAVLVQSLPVRAKSIFTVAVDKTIADYRASVEAEKSKTERKYIMFAWFNSEYNSVCERNWLGATECVRMKRLIPFTDIICQYLDGMHFNNAAAHELAPLLNTLFKRFLGTTLITEISDDERGELMVCWHHIVHNYLRRRTGVSEDYSIDECFPIKIRGDKDGQST